MGKLIFEEEAFAIRGAVFDVYREMGAGFLEVVYQECLEREMSIRAIPFTSQKELGLIYKGEELKQIYKPDIICYEKIIVELKAVKEIASEHKAQLFNYMRATGLRLGFLVNFGSHPKATIERIVI